MKNKDYTLFNENRTLVMSLIGMSDHSRKAHSLQLLQKLNYNNPNPDLIADLSILKLKRKETIWYNTIHNTNSFASTLPCYYQTNKSSNIDRGELIESIIEQIEEGVKLITIHPTPNKELYELSKSRMVPCTSRGGNIVLQDLIHFNFLRPNLYIDILPEIIHHANKHNTIISIGSSYRSANIFDSLDKVQLKEIEFQVQLANSIKEKGVQVIIETPGHASPKKILELSRILNQNDIPIMPLGPIITDTGIGMDHITASIGAFLLGINSNVKIIASVTEEEHTGKIPTDKSILYALKTAKLTAHIIDMYRFEDYQSDYEIATGRSIYKTCIYGNKNKGCSRCNDTCPLIQS